MSRAERIVRGLKAVADKIGLDDVVDDALSVFGRKEAATARRATVPARPAPPPAKIDVYHGTKHRLKPGLQVRDTKTGAEHFIESPTGERVRGIPAALEPVKEYPLGRFSMDKIGTGSGAQIFGHGLYFSKHPDIARQYRHGYGDTTVFGRNVYDLYNTLEEQANALPSVEAQPLYDRLSLMDDLLNAGDTLEVNQSYEKGAYSPETMQWFRQNVEPGFEAPGALYHAQLQASPEQFLHYTKTLAEQPLVLENIAPLVQKYDLANRYQFNPAVDTGGDLARVLEFGANVQGGPRQKAEQVARELVGAGVPGIRYRDLAPGDREAENYVVMNPDLIEIMKRYRVGGAVTEGEC